MTFCLGLTELDSGDSAECRPGCQVCPMNAAGLQPPDMGPKRPGKQVSTLCPGRGVGGRGVGWRVHAHWAWLGGGAHACWAWGWERMHTGHRAKGRMRMRAGHGVGRGGGRMPLGMGADTQRRVRACWASGRGVGRAIEIMGAPAAPVSARRVRRIHTLQNSDLYTTFPSLSWPRLLSGTGFSPVPRPLPSLRQKREPRVSGTLAHAVMWVGTPLPPRVGAC